MANVDYFLKIDGIDGESTDDKHKGEIDVESWSWGASQSGTFAVKGGSDAGKVQMNDFSFSMHTNKASPKAFLACASGQHIKQAVLTARKAGGAGDKGVEFMKITLSDLLVSSYQTAGAGVIGPSDSVALNFSKISVEYRAQKADGSLDAAVVGSWDLKANKKV